MLKKIFASTIFLLMFVFTAQTSAMTFYPPETIGSVGLGGRDSLSIKGATYIDAESDGKTYSRGYAIFGNGLYMHFDNTTIADYNAGSWFGGSDKNNSVNYYVFEGGTRIYQLPNDENIPMYLLSTEFGAGNSMTVIGERDGQWVTFFNTYEGKKYFALSHECYIKNFHTDGDTIIFTFEDFNTKEISELFYTWNSATKSFGVQKI